MKLAFLALSAASLLIAGQASAADTANSTDVTVNGSVANQCGIGNQSGGGVRSLPNTVDLGSLVTADGQLATGTTTVIGFNNVWCNAPNTLTMTVTPLKLLSPPPAFDASSFTDHLTLTVGSDGNNSVLPTYFAGATTLSSGAASANGVLLNTNSPAFETGTGKYSQALLTYSMPSDAHSPGIRPLAGSYQGVVTISVTPN